MDNTQIKRASDHRTRKVFGLVPVLALLLAWELVARAGLFRPVLFPPLSIVLRQWALLFIAGGLPIDIAVTTFRAATGFVLAIIAGVSIGLAMARLRLVNWFFEPLIAIGFSTPTITLVPVFIIWFGIGSASKILLVMLACFFPIVLSTVNGARRVNQRLIWSAQTMGTTERQILWRVILPAALPFIFSGIRISLPLSLIVTFVAEMVGGGGGLGYTLVYGYRFLETPTVFAVLLTILVLGFLLDRSLLYTRRHLLQWDEEAEDIHT